jgi:hypothetical protein
MRLDIRWERLMKKQTVEYVGKKADEKIQKGKERNEVWESLKISSCLTADWDCEDLWRSLAGRRRYGWHWVEGAATTSDRGTCQPEVRWSGSRIKSYWERRRERGLEHGNKICVNENPLFVSGPFSIDSAKWNQMRETHLNPKIKDI